MADFDTPFIEDITVKVIDEVVTLTQEKSQDLKETLTEAEGLLVSYTRKTYQRMAEIDQRLRGKGYPKSVNIQKTDRYETPMIEFIKGSVSAELKTYRPKSRFEQFYQNNKFLVDFAYVENNPVKAKDRIRKHLKLYR
jgi:hypothetical protein